MAAKKKAVRDTMRKQQMSDAVMASMTPDRVLHAIAHVSRIQRKLEENPKHAGRKQFEEALEQYKELLGGVDPAVLADARRKAESIHDMTPQLASRAVKHLEG